MRDQPLVDKPLCDEEEPCCAFGQQAPSPTPHPHGVLADHPQVCSLSCANYRPLTGISSTLQAVQAETGSGIVCLSTNGQPAAWLPALLVRAALVVTAGASLLPHLSTALPHLHAADQHGEQQHSACGGQMLVEKQLCPGEDGCASPLASSSAVPLQHRRGTGVLLLALGGTIPMRFAHKEHGKWICHLHGFCFFFFLTKVKTTKNVITLPCCCYKQS